MNTHLEKKGVAFVTSNASDSLVQYRWRKEFKPTELARTQNVLRPFLMSGPVEPSSKLFQTVASQLNHEHTVFMQF